MSLGPGLLGAFLLLFANAFFVGASFALVSARRTKIEPLAASSRRARRTLRGTNRCPWGGNGSGNSLESLALHRHCVGRHRDHGWRLRGAALRAALEHHRCRAFESCT